MKYIENTVFLSLILFEDNINQDSPIRKIIDSYYFRNNNIQVIIISDNRQKNHLHKENSNISFIDKNGDIADHITGKYFLFLEDNTIISENVFEEIFKNIYSKNNEEIIILSDYISENDTINLKLNMNITSDYHMIIPKSLLKYKDLNQILNSPVKVIKKEDNFEVDERFFNNKLSFYKLFMDRYPIILEYLLIKEIEKILELSENRKINFSNKMISKIKEILFTIDYSEIEKYNINIKYLNFINYLKSEEVKIEEKDDTVILKIYDTVIDDLTSHRIWIDFVEINKDTLFISGIFQSYFALDNISIKVLLDNSDKEVVKCNYCHYTSLERDDVILLNQKWIYRYNFETKIRIDPKVKSKISFIVEYCDNHIKSSFKPQIEFHKHASLSNNLIFTLTNNKNNILFRDSTSITIIKYTYSNLLKMDVRNLIKNFKYDKNTLKMLGINISYLLLYPILENRKIWLLNDRIDSSDDNAKHLLRYINKTDNKKIHPYYVIDKNSDYYKILKKEFNNIVAFGSVKHKILYLFSDKIISSFLNENFYNPFIADEKLNENIKNLYPQKKYFLQHGVISRDLTKHIKKFNHNLKLIVTSSDYERNSFFDLEYNFDKETVQALGLPRYDNLKNLESKHQILFIPSWRSYLKSREDLIHSDYYKSIISLINNKRLEKILEEKGFKLIFKAHPELIKEIDLFYSNKIQIDTKTSFQKLFGQSDILITDFSSVIFDFAYLKKPVIYYQPNDDYHYEEGYFNYETMGFGQVINDEDELINKIEYYLNNNCRMEDIFEKRAESFFKYHDTSNSKRVYEWILRN